MSAPWTLYPGCQHPGPYTLDASTLKRPGAGVHLHLAHFRLGRLAQRRHLGVQHVLKALHVAGERLDGFVLRYELNLVRLQQQGGAEALLSAGVYRV